MAQLSDGKQEDPLLEFAGRTPALPPGGPSLLVGPVRVDVQEGGAGVAWWGPRTLAVAGVNGGVALAALPGATNVLGEEPASFAPGRRALVP